MMFNVTFNNISIISWGQFYWWRKAEYPEKITGLPQDTDYELSIFHLNARSVRNKLSYLEDIASESSIICATESHLDTNIVDNDIILMGFLIKY